MVATPSGSSTDFDSGVAGSSLASNTPRQALNDLEKAIVVAHQKQRLAGSILGEASVRAAQAAAALEDARARADSTKDKVAKEAALEEAETAEGVATGAAAEVADAEVASQAADANVVDLTLQLRRAHMRFTADNLVDEARETAQTYKEVIGDTGRMMDQASAEHAQIGSELLRRERMALREEAAQELVALRDLVDPDFYRDLKLCDELPLHAGDLKAGESNGGGLFGEPPKVPGFKYPQPTPPLPHGKGLRSVAKYKGTERLVLDAKTANEREVSIRRVELGDATQAVCSPPLSNLPAHPGFGGFGPAPANHRLLVFVRACLCSRGLSPVSTRLCISCRRIRRPRHMHEAGRCG